MQQDCAVLVVLPYCHLVVQPWYTWITLSAGTGWFVQHQKHTPAHAITVKLPWWGLSLSMPEKNGVLCWAVSRPKQLSVSSFGASLLAPCTDRH